MPLDHRQVDKNILPTLQEELAKIKLKANKKLAKKFVFDAMPGQFDHSNTMKQCFWLNILNFMTLFRLAEIKLIKPVVFKVLNKFPPWMSFMYKNVI